MKSISIYYDKTTVFTKLKCILYQLSDLVMIMFTSSKWLGCNLLGHPIHTWDTDAILNGYLDETCISPACAPRVLHQPVFLVHCLWERLSFLLHLLWAAIGEKEVSPSNFVAIAQTRPANSAFVLVYGRFFPFIGDSFCAKTDDSHSMVKPGTTFISVRENSSFIVIPARVASSDSNSERSSLECVFEILNISWERCHSACTNDSLIIFVLARFIVTCVWIVCIQHATIVTWEVPIVLHPAAITAICAIPLAKLGSISRSICGAVDAFLFRESDSRSVTFDSHNRF